MLSIDLLNASGIQWLRSLISVVTVNEIHTGKRQTAEEFQHGIHDAYNK